MHVDQAVEDEDPVEAAPEPYLRTSRPLEKDEILEPDQSVYMMLHRMNVQWPCLSFDVLRVSFPLIFLTLSLGKLTNQYLLLFVSQDSLGDERRKFPHTAYVVTGSFFPFAFASSSRLELNFDSPLCLYTFKLAGTQADNSANNEVLVMKMGGMHRTQHDDGELEPPPPSRFFLLAPF